MKINLRQEIAMWVLGLAWTGLGLLCLVEMAGTVGFQLKDLLFGPVLLFILLVPIFLVIFSLRDRKKD